MINNQKSAPLKIKRSIFLLQVIFYYGYLYIIYML